MLFCIFNQLDFAIRERKVRKISDTLGVWLFCQDNDANIGNEWISIRIFEFAEICVAVEFDPCTWAGQRTNSAENGCPFIVIAGLTLPLQSPAAGLQADIVGPFAGNKDDGRVLGQGQNIVGVRQQHQ